MKHYRVRKPAIVLLVLIALVIVGGVAAAAPAWLANRNGGFVVSALADKTEVTAAVIDRLAPLGQAGSYPELAARIPGLLNQGVVRRPVEVRGIYMSGYTAGSARANDLIDLIDQTELNAVVVDIKDDSGQVTYYMDIPEVRDIKAESKKIADIDAFIAKLNEHNIYPIARIVTFKDNVLATARPELAVHHSNGTVWKDRTGQGWLNPYQKGTWDYNIALAKDAASHGFREIQFDYVRFPSDGQVKDMVFPGADGRKHKEVIRDFLKYAHEQLEPLGVFVSADVFGLVTAAADDLTIGQQFEDIIANVDYVCPMVYPSHYGPGNYGLPDPDQAPYQTVYKAMMDGVKRMGDSKAIIRPWLQDFTLRAHYGPEEVRAQIQAVNDAGLKEWILWNPWNKYTAGALKPKGE